MEDTPRGRGRGIHHRNISEATFGGLTTHIRFDVSPNTLISSANISFHVRLLPSQRPGHSCWTRQVHTRDETSARTPITLAKLDTRISNSVAKFLDVSFVSSSIVIID